MVYSYKLPKLKYAYNALEPYIDVQTIEIHYNKHHRAYVSNLNAAIKVTEMEKKNLMELFLNMTQYPVSVRNSGSGYFNYTLFFANNGS